MRPVSIFSATLCGVLWASVGAIVRAAPQTDIGDGETTPSTTAPAIPKPTDFSLECLAVYAPEVACQNACRGIGVVRAATEGCTKLYVPPGLTTDVSTALTSTRTVTDNIAHTTSTITLVNGMPLYETTAVENYGTPVTRTFTFTRGVSDSAATDSAATATAPGSEASSSADRPAATAGNDGSSATTTAVPARSSGGGGKSNTGAIAGGVVGGILGLLLIAAAIFFIRRRKRKSAPRDAFSSLEKNRGESSPQSTTMPQIPITSYDPPQLMEMQEPHPESQRSLMGSYPPPTGMAPAKQQVEVDEDGVSLRSPTPPLGEEDAERGRDYVPRLPIYHRGSDETPRGPAL